LICSIMDDADIGVLQILRKLFLTCPFKECRHKLSYEKFYYGHESAERLGGNYGLEGMSGLGSWPLPDSHFYSCICKPIKCDMCGKTLAEKEMSRHRQYDCIVSTAEVGAASAICTGQAGSTTDAATRLKQEVTTTPFGGQAELFSRDINELIAKEDQQAHLQIKTDKQRQ